MWPAPFPASGRRRRGGRRLGLRLPAAASLPVLLFMAAVVLVGYLLSGPNTSSTAERSPPPPTSASPPPVPAAADSPRTPAGEPAERSPHLLLGNPSNATPDPANRTNFLIVRRQYALSYNDQTATANWASWRLQQSDLGDAPRLRTFLTDDELPRGFYRVTHQDYTSSGFDRGHLVPHSDRDATPDDAAATYRMTNIIPQAPNINQRSWATLESYARGLVAGGRHTLFIVAGPHGRGGVGSSGPAETIARGRITVPAECWKVIVVVPGDRVDRTDRITASTRVIAVRVPNDDRIDTVEWAGFRTTPRDIERRTGLVFFNRLPPQVADSLRDQLDRASVPTPTAPRYLR